MTATKLKTVRVWDLPTRLFHWSLVLLLAFLWYSGGGDEALMAWHMRAGYLLLALLLFRIAWGFIGSPWSRFRNFVATPRTAIDYGLRFLRGQQPIHLTHNPLGGLMVLAMLALLLLQTLTGLFATDDISIHGPLNDHVTSATARMLTRIHNWNFDLLLILAALHLLAVIAHRLRHEPLTLAMITGRKNVPDPNAPDHPYTPIWKAALVIAGTATLVWTLVTFA